MAELQNPLPPGWDCQCDRKSGRYYYVNHLTKTTTWDDPRLQHKPRHPAPIVPVEHIVMQDLSHVTRGSPRTSRLQDTTLSAAANTEEAVTKISTMFPTVSDTHIRLLLKKYMKFIFPKAEETMILDILSGNDNNIQKASEILIEMGFEKRDNAKKQSVLSKPEPAKVQHAEPDVVPAIKSVAEKKIIQSTLEEKYNDIPGQVVTIALESVNFDEHRANQILEIMVKEENDKVVPEIQTESTEDTATDLLSGTIPISQSRQSLKSLLKSEKSDYSMKGSSSFSRIIEERTDDMGGEYRSSNASLPTGANRRLAKGADQELLLEDYVKWQGPSLYQGPTKGLAKGPNPYLRQARTYQACGPNAALRKGPKFGLAKGSIFSQIKGVVSGESRGK
uniref:WW domain-containing protein n=1 Tax=Photinus pyralis TaxID=7054 RepID=A0A1Y1MY13_PHOPY